MQCEDRACGGDALLAAETSPSFATSARAVARSKTDPLLGVALSFSLLSGKKSELIVVDKLCPMFADRGAATSGVLADVAVTDVTEVGEADLELQVLATLRLRQPSSARVSVARGGITETAGSDPERRAATPSLNIEGVAMSRPEPVSRMLNASPRLGLGVSGEVDTSEPSSISEGIMEIDKSESESSPSSTS